MGGRGATPRSGTGNDTMTPDKTTDTIDCGTGRDIVIADRIDAVASDCETVRRPERMR